MVLVVLVGPVMLEIHPGSSYWDNPLIHDQPTHMLNIVRLPDGSSAEHAQISCRTHTPFVAGPAELDVWAAAHQ